MPVHDWSRIDEGIFHDFHLVWIGNLRTVLNSCLLPPDYYALVEQSQSYVRKQRTLVIRHASHHRIIALLEILSAGNKSSQHALDAFVEKALSALDQGIHLLLVDLHPPGPRDPQGIHGVMWENFTGKKYEAPSDKPLTLVAYAADTAKTAYVEPVAVGDRLKPMPLFLTPGQYVNVDLESTYQMAYAGLPRFYRNILEA